VKAINTSLHDIKMMYILNIQTIFLLNKIMTKHILESMLKWCILILYYQN